MLYAHDVCVCVRARVCVCVCVVVVVDVCHDCAQYRPKPCTNCGNMTQGGQGFAFALVSGGGGAQEAFFETAGSVITFFITAPPF